MAKGHLPGLSIGVSLAVAACSHAGNANKHRPGQDPSARASTSAEPDRWEAGDSPSAAPVPAGPLHFLAIGGGANPESTEVSLEQDIDHVRRALPGPGLVLFAGGSGSESVRELDPARKGDPVMMKLGELFSPRVGRTSRYRPPRFTAERASLENVEAQLMRALSEGDTPFLVHVAAHGDQGKEANGNSVVLWGGRSLTVTRLAELHEQRKRPLRLVATSCFSGGFAELAFAHADEKAGSSPVPRCGLFAGTWDRETSGCDPNPDRREQESYGAHFVHALGGTRKDGTPLPAGAADFDHDGKVGLLDAHTWARIEARSMDVPTTTSERWLRSVETTLGAPDPKLLPEDAAVIERLGKDLRLPDENAVTARFDELDKKLAELDDGMDAADDALAARTAEETTLLLERFPVLDDPFHPDFELTFERNRHAIDQALTSSDQAKERARAAKQVDKLEDELGQKELEEARVLRLRRAYETMRLASALVQRGGPGAAYYLELLACERAAP